MSMAGAITVLVLGQAATNQCASRRAGRTWQSAFTKNYEHAYLSTNPG
jgi:hypothetical protein